MADERTTMQQSQSETKVARSADGREMSALSYATIYRQKLKEEQVRRISESKLRPSSAVEDAEKEQEKENRRLAMEARLREEREAVAARNAAADAVLTDVSEREAAKAAAKAAAEQAALEAASAPVAEAAPTEVPVAAEPAVATAEASASVPSTAEEKNPTPVLQRTPVAAPTPAVMTSAPKPAAVASRPVKSTATSSSCVVEIRGGELKPVADGRGGSTYALLPDAEDDGVLYITGDEITDVIFGAEDEDIVYLTEDADIPSVKETAEPDTEATVADTEDASEVEEAAPAQPTETVYTGEPKLHEEDAEQSLGSHRRSKKNKKQSRRDAKHEAGRRARSLREAREQEEARLAEEAVRAALAPEEGMTPSRASQEEKIRRLVARQEADRAVANALRDEEAARVAALKAEAEAEELAVTRENNEKREAQRAAFEAARAAAEAEEQALLAEQAAAEAEERRKQEAAREAYDASVRELTERVMADELSADEAEAERVRRMQDADAAKNVRIAAAKAERASERDRALAERAEDEALNDSGIKDWRTGCATAECSEEDERVEATETSGPRRIDPRAVSYSRKERRALAEAAEQRRLDRIAAEVALWNERETEESAYAALPEDVEMMSRRELKTLFREQLKSLEKLNRICTRTLLLLKRKVSSSVAVRAGYEAIVAERDMIESMTRAIKIARIAKIRGQIRPLARRMAKEIRRERKFIKFQSALAGFAPVPCDPTMPKAVRKKRPYKLPTTLYRTEEDKGAQE